MNPNNMNFGSGSPLLGGVSPLQKVMSQMNQGQAGALQMKTPSAAGFDPGMNQSIQGGMPPPPPGNVTPNPMSGGQNMPPMGISQGTPEAQIIIEALAKRLDNDSKMNHKKIDRGMM